MAVLWINDVEMPDPSGITVTREPIWSSNAGRGSTGKFTGDIVTRKYKLEIKWPVMSQKESAKLGSAISSDAFFPVKFIDPESSSGAYVTKTMYTGTPTYPVYSYVDGLPRLTGVGVDLIEQ